MYVKVLEESTTITSLGRISRVLLTTCTAITIKERSCWIHRKHAKLDPGQYSQDTRKPIRTGDDLQRIISGANSPAPAADDAEKETATRQDHRSRASSSLFWFFFPLPLNPPSQDSRKTKQNSFDFFIYLFYFLFFGCVGSSFLCEGFL